ncbi:hypothetical protein LJC59_01590 [Desulfovibrio sp. OttesenSCG-928-A18]|nr:hypothetical protein [Desulfovibrio sp. OttesenSCG-928-A18]
MKPVAEKQTHYSVLLMRDDCRARTLHIRCSTLRYLFGFCIMFILAGTGGIVCSALMFKEYYVLYTEHEQQNHELAEIRLQLERFQNYETLLQASNGGQRPQAQNQEVGVPAPVSGNGASAARSLNPDSTSPVSSGMGAQVDSTVAASGNANEAASTAPEAQSPAPADGQYSDLDAIALAAMNGEQTQNAAQEQSRPVTALADSPLRIDRFTATNSSSRQLRLRYNLAVRDENAPKTTYVGEARYQAQLSKGDTVTLEPTKGTSTSNQRFSFSNLKPMEASLRLPDGIQSSDVAKIDILLVLDEGSSYRESYELE